MEKLKMDTHKITFKYSHKEAFGKSYVEKFRVGDLF